MQPRRVARRILGEPLTRRVRLATGGTVPEGPSGLRAGARPGGGSLRRAFDRLPAPLRRADLTDWAWHFGTDKWGSHWYTPHYERHLGHLRRKRFTLLEIGVGGYDWGAGGESLRMWSAFFPRARIVGLDLVDKTRLSRGRVVVRRGDQTDPELLRSLVTEFGPVTVVVDDGSHRPEHVRETFRILFPLLPDGAFYAIEDTQTSYWPGWGGSLDRSDPTTTMGLVKDLLDGLNHEEFLVADAAPSATDRTVRAVHCYHNLVVIEKGDNEEGSNRELVPGKEGAPA